MCTSWCMQRELLKPGPVRSPSFRLCGAIAATVAWCANAGTAWCACWPQGSSLSPLGMITVGSLDSPSMYHTAAYLYTKWHEEVSQWTNPSLAAWACEQDLYVTYPLERLSYTLNCASPSLRTKHISNAKTLFARMLTVSTLYLDSGVKTVLLAVREGAPQGYWAGNVYDLQVSGDSHLQYIAGPFTFANTQQESAQKLASVRNVGDDVEGAFQMKPFMVHGSSSTVKVMLAWANATHGQAFVVIGTLTMNPGDMEDVSMSFCDTVNFGDHVSEVALAGLLDGKQLSFTLVANLRWDNQQSGPREW